MDQTEQIIEAALSGVREEQSRHGKGSGTVSNPDQLEQFETALAGMLEDVRQRRFLSQRIGLGRIVTDSWPLDHELAERICAAEQAYVRAAERTSASCSRPD
jgi:hypothetical protein